jgi:hypothetical protein
MPLRHRNIGHSSRSYGFRDTLPNEHEVEMKRKNPSEALSSPSQPFDLLDTFSGIRELRERHANCA